MASRFGILLKTVTSMQRYRQILFVLIKYGFGDLISTLGLEHYMGSKWNPMLFKKDDSILHMSRAERIRMMLQELGATFVKMGQVLSTRSDLLPDDILDELSLLTDRVQPFPTEKVKSIIAEELGASHQDIFAEFDERPVAAGSIGQVHRARLKDGRAVALKIQRPGVARSVHIDLEIMHDIAILMERHLDMGKVHKPTRIVEEFARTLELELDYNAEAGNIDRYQSLFGDDPINYVHKVYHEYTTRRVLCLEWVNGIRPLDLDALRAAEMDLPLLAKRGAKLLMTQVFEHGFFHADPHPGNILVLPNNVICFLDYGMMGRIDRESREVFAEIVVHLVAHDEARAADSLLRLTHAYSLVVDRPRLEREIAELMDRYLYRPLANLEIAPLIQSLLDLTAKHELTIPPPFFLLIKAMAQIESLGCRLDPDFDLSSQLAPYLRKIILARYHPERVAQQVYETSSDMLYLMREVPGEMRELLKQARTGSLKVEVEPLGLPKLTFRLERIAARISSAIVLASMIVGSSLIVHSRIPPTWGDVPLIGLAGYLVSAMMAVSLLHAILKDKKRQ